MSYLAGRERRRCPGAGKQSAACRRDGQTFMGLITQVIKMTSGAEGLANPATFLGYQLDVVDISWYFRNVLCRHINDNVAQPHTRCNMSLVTDDPASNILYLKWVTIRFLCVFISFFKHPYKKATWIQVWASRRHLDTLKYETWKCEQPNPKPI